MTSAPDTLVQARRLLLEHLDITPGRTAAADLDPAEVGIVGDPAHVGGYHCGADRVRRVDGQIRDYSVTESDRDLAGLADWACALDIGQFEVRVASRTYGLPHLSAWIVAQCRAGAPDARDIREVIYSPDGQTVRRWDRLGLRSTGDGSHRWHTHISYHRDAIKAGRDQTGLFRRYLTEIGLLVDETEDDMPLTAADISAIATRVWSATWGPESAGDRLLGAREEARRARLTAEATLAAVQGLDTKAVLARVEQVAADERTRDEAAARRDAELAALVRAGQTGQLAADELLRRLGEVLTAGTDPGQARG